MARPAKWYESILRVDVKDDLDKHPRIKNKLGSYQQLFINWCAKQRVQYVADILDECEQFEREVMKSRLYDTNVKLWKEISNKIFQRDNYTCVYCNKIGGKLEVDHIIPISRGGGNELSNLATACRKCNRQKKDRTPDEFVRWRDN